MLINTERLAYIQNEGFRTAIIILPFKMLGGFSEGENKMARPRGFEPLASASGGQRSIQLSYGRRVVDFRLGIAQLIGYKW